jgi:RNA polymerase sigma-70 factor (ECF subfamily)
MSDAPSTRKSLLVRLKDPGDAAAWDEFVSLYGPLVRTLARRGGLQDADAHDLEQEVYRSVAAAIDRYDPNPERGSFRGWLFRIARNHMLNAFVARKRHPQGSGDTRMGELLEAHADPAPNPDETALFDAAYRKRLFEWAAQKAREHFKEATWLAFWRTAVEGREIAAVAAELGLTTGAIYVHRNRVMARIKELISDIENESS